MKLKQSKNRKFISRILYATLLNTLLGITIFIAFKSLNIGSFSLVWSSLEIPLFIISILLFILFYVIHSYAWCLVLHLYIVKTNIAHAATFMFAQMFKYLPSSIFSFSFRYLFLKRFGVSGKQSTKAILMEQGFLIYTGFIVFIFFLSFSKPLLMLSVPFLILVIYAGFLVAKKNIFKVQKVPLLRTLCSFENFSYLTITKIIVLYLLGWSIAGLSIYCFSYSVNGERVNIFNTIAVQSLSYSASILAIFSPGGIGIKELVLQMTEIEDNIILNWRIVTMIIDIVVSLCAIVIAYLNTPAKMTDIKPSSVKKEITKDVDIC